MAGPKEPQSTSPIVSTVRAHVVYDRKSGQVLHVHETVTFPNGAPTQETPEARAMRLAGASRSPDAEVIEVDPAAVKGHHRIRINPRDRTIERMEAPGR